MKSKAQPSALYLKWLFSFWAVLAAVAPAECYSKCSILAPIRRSSTEPLVGIQISIDNLHKVYHNGPQKVHILKGVNLDIAAGAQVAISGVSGAGKSTLLHVLGALDRPSEGSVRYDGQSIFEQSDRALAKLRNRRIGFVFQFHHLLEDFSALDNVAMPLLIGGLARAAANELASEALKRVGLGHRLTHLPSGLSGGEQQRVAIARALVRKPDLLLMDEPTGNLDTATANDIHDLLCEVGNTSGATLIIVTHNEALAARLATRYQMRDGVVS